MGGVVSSYLGQIGQQALQSMNQQWAQLGQQQMQPQLFAATHDHNSDSTILRIPNNIMKKTNDEEKKESPMLGEMKQDFKTFIRGHKDLIYTLIGLYLLDHFMLEGKMKAKLLEIVNRLVSSVEKKVDSITAAPNDTKQ